MIKIEHDIKIIHPRILTFDYIINFENNPDWQTGMSESVLLTEGPVGLGTKFRQKASFMGREMDSIFEVVEFEQDRIIRLQALEAPFPITVTRIVEGDDDHSHVHAIMEAAPTGMLKLASGMIRNVVAEAVEKDHATLKEKLESRGITGS